MNIHILNTPEPLNQATHTSVSLSIACALALILSPTAASALDYYVSTTGSDTYTSTQAQNPATPWKTILKADRSVTAGATIHVGAGSYTGGFTTSKSGSATSPITYISDTQWGAKIKGTSGTSGWTSNGAYVTINGFEVDGTGNTTWKNGIYATGTGDKVKRNHVHHVMNNKGCPSNGGSGINTESWYGGSAIDVTANLVHDIGPANQCQYIHGIYVIAPGGHIYNNITYSNSGYGIHLWHDDRNEFIVNNTVFNNRTGAIIHGADLADLYSQTTCAHDNYFANNILYDNANNNILLVGDCAGSNHVLANNLIGTNPQFVNYIRTGGGDYHLLATSPALQAGTLLNAPSDDINGQARIGNPDLGAYEYLNTVVLNPPANLRIVL